MPSRSIAIFLGILLAGLAIAIFHWRSRQPVLPDNGASGASLTIVKPVTGNRILIEAEDCIAMAPPFTADPEQPPAGASGKCLYVGPEKWNENYQQGKIKIETEKGHEAASFPGYARYEFTVPASDDYALWLRAFWRDDCGDSVEISVDGGAPKRLGGSTHGRWTWNRLSLSEGGPVLLRLAAGQKHILTICNREDDLYLDQILLLGTDRTWPEPVDIEKP